MKKKKKMKMTKTQIPKIITNEFKENLKKIQEFNYEEKIELTD